MKKKIIGAIFALSMFMACARSAKAQAAEMPMYRAEDANSFVKYSADLYVENKSEEIIFVAGELADCFGYTKDGWDSLEIGEPYVIERVGADVQDEIYYYPLINGEDIVLVISVFNATDGWSYSLSEEMVSRLNYIDFENNQENYNLYYDENELLVESKEGFVVFPEEESSFVDDSSTYMVTSRSVRTTYNGMDLAPLTRMPGYYPKYSINESTYKECDLYYPAGQGNYGRCWAAVCATMLNYEFGFPFTAAHICDLTGIGYDEGANSQVMRETLVAMGLNRRIYRSQLAWGDIITEINNKRLIGLGAATETYEDGHMVTIFGYRRIANYCYLILWNSGLNEGRGGRQVVIYDEYGTSFTYADMEFTWIESIAR